MIDLMAWTADGTPLSRPPGQRRGRSAALLDIAHPQPVEQIFEDSLLLGREISGRALAQHVEQVDVQAGRVQVFHRLPVGQGRVSEVEGDRFGENADEIEKGRPEPGGSARQLEARRSRCVCGRRLGRRNRNRSGAFGRDFLLSGVDLLGRRRRGLELGREVLAHPPIRGEHAPICDFDVAHGQ
jgi:hypothetical protein